MAVSVMIKIDALGEECAKKPVSWQAKLFEASFPAAREKTNSGPVVLAINRSTRAKAPTTTRVAFFVRGFRHKAKRRTVFPSIANSTTTADVIDSSTTRLKLLEARDIAKRIDLQSGHWKPLFRLPSRFTEKMQLLNDSRRRTSAVVCLERWSTFNLVG